MKIIVFDTILLIFILMLSNGNNKLLKNAKSQNKVKITKANAKCSNYKYWFNIILFFEDSYECVTYNQKLKDDFSFEISEITDSVLGKDVDLCIKTNSTFPTISADDHYSEYDCLVSVTLLVRNQYMRYEIRLKDKLSKEAQYKNGLPENVQLYFFFKKAPSQFLPVNARFFINPYTPWQKFKICLFVLLGLIGLGALIIIFYFTIVSFCVKD